jgi:hypothetical protein
MKKVLFLALTILLSSQSASTQTFSFGFDQSIKVSNDAGELPNAWAGGFNSAQVSTIDLNGDTQQDVVIFDRTNYKISTFVRQNGTLRYAPDYEALFPPMENWCLLIDYDNDGKKDIFTATRAGIRVFKNVSEQGKALTFRLFKDGLSVKSTTGNILRLLPDLTDIPAIADMDNDGDLDILNFIPLTGQNIEFSKNFSMERYNRPDSLEFEKTTLFWGGISECTNCNEYFFNNNTCRTEKAEHSGHALVALDLNGDNLKDFLLSDVNCTGLVAFTNRGTPTNAAFNNFTPNFPVANPVNITSFPASYIEDVDGDGIRDLLVSPNQFFNDGNRIDFTNSLWFYKNTGTNGTPNFTFQKKNFIQDQMIDLGEYVKPVFADYDADGDLDLFVSNGGQTIDKQPFIARVFLFENIGSSANPAFRLVNGDYANFSQLNLRFLKINFADLNNDGTTDLAFTATSNTDGRASLRYTLNTAKQNERFSFNINSLSAISLPAPLSPFDEPLFLDLDGDRDQDLLIGRFQGGLHYLENTGNLAFTLKNNQLGGIADDFERRALSLAVTDFNKNGKPDLLTGDRSGSLNIYLDITDRLSTNFTQVDKVLVFNSLQNKNIIYDFGAETSPAVLGDDIAVGLTGGGLVFLKNKNAITGIENTKSESQIADFQIFPNPSFDKVIFKSTKKGAIRILNLLGGQVLEFQKIIPDFEHETSLRVLPAGVYLVEFRGENGEKVIKKLIVYR